MENSIRVSVVMGVYNPVRSHFLEAVQSIQRQTYTDWEMLIIDDGSSEETTHWMQKIIQPDKRIRYIYLKKNMGLGAALNIGIYKSRGQYIARMDADDISHVERLKIMVDFMDAHPQYQWVGSVADLYDENVWGRHLVPEKPERKSFLPYSPYIHPSVMFRKSILMENGGYCTSKETRRCEDYELFMRLHRKGYKGYNLQRSLLLYRENSESYERRRYRNYINEFSIRKQGFRSLGLLHLSTVPYVVKPLIVGLIPPKTLGRIKKKVKGGKIDGTEGAVQI